MASRRGCPLSNLGAGIDARFDPIGEGGLPHPAPAASGGTRAGVQEFRVVTARWPEQKAEKGRLKASFGPTRTPTNPKPTEP